MISFCLATRNRPDNFKKMCQSALDLADDPHNIEFVSYHDIDDISVYEYIGNHKEVVGLRDLNFLFTKFNECQKVATGPIYCFIADDFYFTTKHWDTEVMKMFDKYDDKIVLVCPDGRFWRNWRLGVVGFVHQNWVDAVGYIFPPYEGGQAADRWINDLAIRVNRRVRLDTVNVVHDNCKDAVHKDKNRVCKRNEWTRKYWMPEAEKIRKEDADKLQKFIDTYKKDYWSCPRMAV